MIQSIILWFEDKAFGVCHSIGKYLGIPAGIIRKYFVYLSFFTFGSPVIIYFVLLFFKENKRFFQRIFFPKANIWEL
ncbi:MAG: PspC domain-containing protein [Bacteroidia bacterium]|nr:PspC domain-containing protein [Bacteroidia bacterium]